MRKEKSNKNNTKNKFYKTNPSGISLIVLVITIIVIIILAAAVIISIINNNPISEANRARYESDVANMQMIFTNTIGKIMAQKQETIGIKAGQLNEETSGVKSTVGEAVYTINEEEVGKIFFTNEASENENDYITGKKLPIYSSKTIWNVDEEGILKLQIGDKEYNDGNNSSSGGTTETETETVSAEAYNELLKRVEALEKKEDTGEEKSNPTGTVISYMGNKAPEGYLFCDGKEYNIEEYKDLAEQIKEEFGSYNFYGGNGTVTFAVPDLRGEFLRGTGTNSHSDSGSGSTVGTHQAPTSIPYYITYTDGNVFFKRDSSGTANQIRNSDTMVSGRAKSTRLTPSIAVYEDETAPISNTVRPTNTSVLYCIKY